MPSYERSGNYVKHGGTLLLDKIYKAPISKGGALAANVVGGITSDNVARIFPADLGHNQQFVAGQGIKHHAQSRLAGLLAEAVKQPSVKSHHQKRQNIKFNF